MPGINDICRKIVDDAQAKADEILSAARQKADEVCAAAQREADEASRRAVASAQEKARAGVERQKAVLALEDRKAALAVKQEMVSAVYDRVLENLCALPGEASRELLLSLAGQSGGGELCPAARSAGWIDEVFLQQANELLAARGGQIVTLGPVNDAIAGGFWVRRDGVEIDCSYEALVLSQRGREREVAAALFD